MKQGRIIHQGHFDELKHLEYFKIILNNIKKNEKKVNEELKEDFKIYDKKEHQDSDSEDSEDDITRRGSTINNDENKECIQVSWNSFYRFFFFSFWTITVFLFVVILLSFRKHTNV